MYLPGFDYHVNMFIVHWSACNVYIFWLIVVPKHTKIGRWFDMLVSMIFDLRFSKYYQSVLHLCGLSLWV